MIHITEDFLYEILYREILYLKNNPNELTKNLLLGDKSNTNKLAEYLSSKDNQLFLEHNYPRDPARTPIISIILGSENSTPEGLGSLLLEETETTLIPCTEEITPIYDINNKLILQTRNYPISDVFVSNGTQTISKFNTDRFTSGKISSPSINFIEGRKYRVQYNFINEAKSNSGMQYDVNYRIEVYTQNADLTTILYSLVKYILLKNIPMLESVGYRLINIAGTDFEPMPDYFPGVFLYRRTVMFNAKVVDSIESTQEIIRAIDANIKLYEYMSMLDAKYPSIFIDKIDKESKFNRLLALLRQKNIITEIEEKELTEV